MEGGGREGPALIGRTLGEFVVREELGSGGFGIVFRAEQPALGREAVIKVLHRRLLTSETVVQRFLREARLASRLDHPYAAHIYAFGAEPDGVLWIAMEYVRGTPLDRLLEAQGPVALERFVPLIERICEVVHTAHEQGIVHRDLKPANVMVLARAGRFLPKLLDFGIAKIDEPGPGPKAAPATEPIAPRSGPLDVTAPGSDDDTMVGAPPARSAPGPAGAAISGAVSGRLTNAGAVMGSPLYMAPEQWSDAGAVSARTDIYALGILCYEALTGRAPFEGANSMQIAIAHAKHAPPRLGGALPAELDAVIAKALAKDPADRFASALELAAAFRAASGVAAEPVALPRLDDVTRGAAMLSAPRPLALAIDALDRARNPHQARDALWQALRVAVRLVGVAALAGHSHVGLAAGATDPAIADGIRRLRGRALSDASWLELARDLVAPFAALRDAHPIPELVELLDRRRRPALAELVALRAEADDAGGGADDRVRALLERGLPLLARVLEELAFLGAYPIAVPVEGSALAEDWMGARPGERSHRAMASPSAAIGHPVLLDAGGTPVVSLWPFVQVHEPSPGAAPALFFFEGKGRRGARMIALPHDFEHEDEELWDTLGKLLREPADAAGASATEEACPFPGLAAFTAADAASFHGRERETEAFVNRLRVTPLLAVVGPSGAGKSSFVQAGVVPALPDGWRALAVRPGPAPLVTLVTRLATAGVDSGSALRGEIASDPGALGSALRTFARSGPTVLVIDQLEELFTLCEDAREREIYAEALVRAARSADDPVRVVVTLRDDFLLRAEALPALRSRLGPALQLLTTPAPAELRRILVEPIRRAGYEFDDPALPDEMVDAVASAPGALALLSFTASKLWELRDRRFRQLGHKAYRSLGGVGGALAQHAETTLLAMPDEEQRLVREVFRHAVTSEGTRAVLSRQELDQVLDGGPHAAAVVEKLIAARLLVASDGEGDSERVEVTHEALLDAWPRLVTWRREDAEGARLRDQLRAAARQWEERGRPSGLLWRGDALAEYRLWRARHPGALTASEQTFATAGLAEAARGRRVRRALLAVVIAALAGVAVTLSIQNARVAAQRSRAVANEREAERSARSMHDLLLSQYESQGRRLLLADDPLQSLAYLDAADKLGARGVAHDFLIASAIRATDGMIAAVSHDGMVGRVRFSPDGERLLTAGYDGRARIWDARGWTLLRELAHDGPVVRVEWSRDGARVATASADESVAVWDAASGTLLQRWPQAAPPQAILFTADGGRLLTGTTKDEIRLWDVATGDVLRTYAQREGQPGVPIGSPVAFSPDEERIAAGDSVGRLRLWETRSGRVLLEAKAHDGRINWVRFSSDGRHLVVAGDDGVATVWDLRSGTRTLSLGHRSMVAAATFSPDGTSIATASSDGTAMLWDATTGRPRFAMPHAAAVNQVVFSGDGSMLATASDDGTAQLWEASSGQRLARRFGHRGAIKDVVFDRSGRRIATGSLDGRVIAWGVEPTHRVTRLRGHDGWVYMTAYSPDGSHLVSAGNDATARVWDVATGQSLLVLRHDEEVTSARFDPQGARIATSSLDGAIRLWDARSGEMVARMNGHTGPAVSVDWNRAGTQVVSAGDDGTVRVWSNEGGQAIWKVVAHGGAPLTWAGFDARGERVISVGKDGTVRLLDAGDGRELEVQRGAKGWIGVALDPSGTRLAAATTSRSVSVLDLTTHRTSLELVGHLGDVLRVSWSSDGLLITAGSDGARVWDAATGDMLGAMAAGGERLIDASFAPDGTQCALARRDGLIELWDIPRQAPSRADLERLLRCRVPFAVDRERLISRSPELGACRLAPPP